MVKTRFDFILLLLLSVLYAQYVLTSEYKCSSEDPCGCSTQPATTDESARENSWNWLVSLQDKNGHFCHGSILSEKYIITAAHCLRKTIYPLSNITICIAANRLSDSCREYYAIDNAISHPLYNHETFENDIALIRVQTSLNFINKSIARICLPNADLQMDTDLIAPSWNTNETSNITNDLEQMKMQIVNQSMDTCASTLFNHQTQLCVATLTNSRALLRSMIVCHLIRFCLSFDRFLS